MSDKIMQFYPTTAEQSLIGTCLAHQLRD